jgi:hypothetical protein
VNLETDERTAAKPINVPTKRELTTIPGFSFNDALMSLSTPQILKVDQERLSADSNMNSSDRERLTAKVEQILAADEEQRSYDNALNDVFRKSSFERDNKDMTVVVKVVQQVTMVDNGKQMDLYKQDLIVANRGKDNTKIVMGTLLSPVSNQLY